MSRWDFKDQNSKLQLENFNNCWKEALRIIEAMMWPYRTEIQIPNLEMDLDLINPVLCQLSYLSLAWSVPPPIDRLSIYT